MEHHVNTTVISKHSGRSARLQAGFTLVELITVIVILGVLAAVALPRFADLGGKARAAKVNAVLGSIKAAAGLVKATAIAGGQACTATTGTPVSLEGTSIAINYCYPQALAGFGTGVLGAANVVAVDGWVVDATNGPGGAAAGSALQINLSDGATPANCSVKYTSPAAANGAPTIVADTSAC